MFIKSDCLWKIFGHPCSRVRCGPAVQLTKPAAGGLEEGASRCGIPLTLSWLWPTCQLCSRRTPRGKATPTSCWTQGKDQKNSILGFSMPAVVTKVAAAEEDKGTELRNGGWVPTGQIGTLLSSVSAWTTCGGQCWCRTLIRWGNTCVFNYFLVIILLKAYNCTKH